MELRQTSTVQHYLTEVDRLNSYAAIPDRQLINILIKGINHKLREAMAHYEHLRSTPAAWRDRLIKMDITSTVFRSRDKDQGKDKKRNYDGNRKLEDRISLRGGSAQSTSETVPRVPSPIVRKRRQEERCLKYGRKGHFAADYKTGWQAKTPPRGNHRTPTNNPSATRGNAPIKDISRSPSWDQWSRETNKECVSCRRTYSKTHAPLDGPNKD